MRHHTARVQNISSNAADHMQADDILRFQLIHVVVGRCGGGLLHSMADSHPVEVTNQMGYVMQWVTSGSKRFSTLSALGTKVGYFMGYFGHAQDGLLRRVFIDATSWGSRGRANTAGALDVPKQMSTTAGGR